MADGKRIKQRGSQTKIKRDSSRGPRYATSNRQKGEAMSEQEVVGFLGRKISESMNDEDGDLSTVRKENFSYYVGAEYGDERDGYSKFVTRETLETVEWVMPSILRVFLSGDKIVSFDPVNPDDEDASKQETDITNHFVMKANKSGEGGFLSLHHWIKDTLMYPNGYLKVYMEEKERVDVGTVSGLTEMGVQMIINDEDVEIIEQRSRTEQIEQPMQGPTAMPGQMQNVDVEVFDLKIRTTKQVMELRVDPVPPEECLVDKELTTLNLDEADFVCHRVQKSFTHLVREGHDPDDLDQVGSGDNHQWNDERVNRLFYEDEDPDTEGNDDPSMRMFWVHECHAWFDNDGTGVAQQRRVVLIGDQVFENEETNYQPLIAMSAILMQHKHTGMSYVDIMKDLQILSSVLTRQLLDNIYKINVGKTVFSEDALTEDGATMEALLNRQAEYIPVRGPAMAAFAPEPTQSMVGDLLPVIQHFSQIKAERTGVTPEAGIDANALQEVRQEVFSNAMDRASQRIEMLTRIFAETGFRQLMLKTHQLLRSHWDVARSVKLRGEWVDVDPQGWRDRTDMTINVGLGHHTKQQQLGMLVQLLSMQKEAAASGLSDPAKIYNTLERVINASGVGDVRMAFIDPGTPEKPNPEYKPPQPQPDANMILAQAQAKALEQEQERKGMEAQSKAQHDQQKMQQDSQLKQADLQSKQVDQQLKMRELALKEAELRNNGALAAGELEAKIANLRADTQLKLSNSDKAMADAVAVAVENSEVYQQALKMVEKGGDLNEDNSDGQSEGQDNSEESEGGESSD